MKYISHTVRLFWDVCLLRKGPQDIPYSPELLIVVLLINAGIGWAQLTIKEEFLAALGQTLILLSLSLVFTHIVLQLKGLKNRYVQTLTALMATSVIVTLLIWPFIYLMVFVMLIYEEGSFVRLWANLAALMLIVITNVWAIMISGNIYRLALGIPLTGGILVALSLVGLNILTYSVIT